MQSDVSMKAFVIDLLKERLSPFYYYHQYEHTLYVMEKVDEIGKQSNCNKAELRLLNAAALWHDTGYVNTYSGHEEESCLLAQKHLPYYGFLQNEILTICGMIMATKIPQSPKNTLEEILADADLEYLGTDDAAIKAADLFRELKFLTPSLTKAAWDNIQIIFLQNHSYFTDYCKQQKEPEKQAYLKGLIAAAQ